MEGQVPGEELPLLWDVGPVYGTMQNVTLSTATLPPVVPDVWAPPEVALGIDMSCVKS